MYNTDFVVEIIVVINMGMINHSLNMEQQTGSTEGIEFEVCECVVWGLEFDLMNWAYSCHCGPSVSGKCCC